MSETMVSEILGSFLFGFIIPLPFFFVLYLVRACKKYFGAASNISVE